MGRYADYLIPDYTTTCHSYRKVTSTPPDTIVPRDCGCYDVSTVSETDRVWVTYTTIMVEHNLCDQHFQEHHRKADACRKSGKSIRKEREREWQERCAKAEPASKKEKEKLSEMMLNLKLPRLRDIKTICDQHNWRCTLHRGYVTLNYLLKHSEFCPVSSVPVRHPANATNRCRCVECLYGIRFKYRRHGKTYEFSQDL